MVKDPLDQNSFRRSSVLGLSFVSPLSFKLLSQVIVAALEVLKLSLQLFVFGQKALDIGVTWSAHGFLDIIVHIPWLFRLLVESNKNLG